MSTFNAENLSDNVACPGSCIAAASLNSSTVPWARGTCENPHQSSKAGKLSLVESLDTIVAVVPRVFGNSYKYPHLTLFEIDYDVVFLMM